MSCVKNYKIPCIYKDEERYLNVYATSFKKAIEHAKFISKKYDAKVDKTKLKEEYNYELS